MVSFLNVTNCGDTVESHLGDHSVEWSLSLLQPTFGATPTGNILSIKFIFVNISPTKISLKKLVGTQTKYMLCREQTNGISDSHVSTVSYSPSTVSYPATTSSNLPFLSGTFMLVTAPPNVITCTTTPCLLVQVNLYINN